MPTMEGFSEAVQKDVHFYKLTLFNEAVYQQPHAPGSQLVANLTKEIKQYFTTGNSSGHEEDGSAAKCVNPTLFHSETGKWIVHQACCPFYGYAPLPLKELDRSGEHNGIAFEYCQAELKKLLIAFRKRNEHATFHFHQCDPLVFCYEDSPLSFDVIEGSSFLADNVGLVNFLNAAARNLRSYQSVLFTESAAWFFVAPDVSHYLQTVLCCPLSLIPTIYGLHLIDNVELGPDTFISTRNPPKAFCRLRWKKAQSFEGVALAMSPLLNQCLERLKKLCLLVEAPSSGPGRSCGMSCYSPLTFRYVTCDLIRRGGLPVTAIENFHPPSVFRTAVEAIQAWKERRPVWRVNACIKFDQNKNTELTRFWDSPTHRLILVPNSTFQDPNCFKKLFTSSENHFINNLVVNVNWKANGEIDEVDISFLLADRNLLKTHGGVFMDSEHQKPVLMLGSFGTDSRKVFKVEKFNQPYPYWSQGEESSVAVSPSTDRSKTLTAISCQESKDAFTLCLNLRFNLRSGDKLPKSGKKNYYHLLLH